MLKKLVIVIAIICFAIPVMAMTAAKDGSPAVVVPTDVTDLFNSNRADFEYNTGGSIDFVPTTGGSADGWGEWFIGNAYNDTGSDLLLVELGFPCCGPPTEPYGWLVWISGPGSPPGDAYTADYYGSFTPVDPNPDTFPPTVYTYIDIVGEGIVIPNGAYFTFGYDNTGTGGQTDFNGVDTWAWYEGWWDPDSGWGRTAILQVKGNYIVTPTLETTISSVKALY